MKGRTSVSVGLGALLGIQGCALLVDLPEGSDSVNTGGAASGGAASGGAASGGSAGTSAGCKVACDCDDDGAKSESCAGTDCADDDPEVHPGQSAYMLTPSKNPKIGFDFDCSVLLIVSSPRRSSA
ncbi:MAG: hypothetical protein IPI67_37150 [Myxococcales bacterium]|nr:hypothetical protein [Myxococcales bacterium]